MKIATAAEYSYETYILGAYLPSEGRAGAGEFLMSEIMMMMVLMMMVRTMMMMMMMMLMKSRYDDDDDDEVAL